MYSLTFHVRVMLP